MMLWKCCTQYVSKFEKLSSGHRTGKGQFSFQSQSKAVPKNAQTTTQLHSSHTGGSEVKVSACNVRDLGSIPGSGRSPGKGNGNTLQYSCLENSMDRGAWWAAVHRVAQSQTQLKQLSMHACVGEGTGDQLYYSCLENPMYRKA